MSQSIEEQMLNALEIFHYSNRFQNHLFVLALEEEALIGDIITDLRVLNRAKIRIVLISPYYQQLPGMIKKWNLQGCPLVYRQTQNDPELNQDEVVSISAELENDRIPVIGLTVDEVGQEIQDLRDCLTMNLGSLFAVDKVFFLSNKPGLFIDDLFISHTTPQEMAESLDRAKQVNIGKDRLSRFIEHNQRNGFDIVLLNGKTGCLFQEIFSHRGIGTLITSDYPNIIRRGKTSDIMDISLMMKPYIDTGIILPVSEESLSKEIKNFYVYTVNNSIVAAATLKDYGEAAELAKFCTLPRYQGKGRARELAEMMIEKANQANKHYIFALTVERKMLEFFTNLGFQECDREVLPKSWKSNYDIGRPSTAFIKRLKGN